jgi:hypothetical protein
MTDTMPLASTPDVDTAAAFPLSFQQEFLRLVDHGDGMGPFGPMYTIVGGWRVQGELDVDTLRGALQDVVVRHESLRTQVVLVPAAETGDPYQQVLPPSTAEVLVTDLAGRAGDRDTVAEEYLNEVETGEFDRHQQPLIRLVVGRFDSTDTVVILMAHHTSCDGWSAQVVIRDLAACYAARLHGQAPQLPPVRQLREYVAWQRANADSPSVAAAREYWREHLRDARMLALRTDLPRPEHGAFVTGWHRFLIEEEFRTAAAALATRTRSTPFIVLLAAYLVHLRDLTGVTDLVVPTFTPGRHPAWVQDTVGTFYNFLPLRTDITACASILDVIAKVRAACLRAYANEIPFLQIAQEAPDLMNAVMEPTGACAVFQVVQSPFMMLDEQIGGLRWAAMRRRVLSVPVGSQLPDGALWSLELHPDGDILGKIGYTGNLFFESTIAAWVADYRRILRTLAA